MGKYCKAYPISFLREFEGWTEKPQSNGEQTEAAGRNSNASAAEVNAGDYVYIQDDYTVTGSIFKDEAVIFDAPTPEWMDFCKNRLNFEVPAHEPAG
jgi:hypothetical protein